jgi:hypothetical protein
MRHVRHGMYDVVVLGSILSSNKPAGDLPHWRRLIPNVCTRVNHIELAFEPYSNYGHDMDESSIIEKFIDNTKQLHTLVLHMRRSVFNPSPSLQHLRSLRICQLQQPSGDNASFPKWTWPPLLEEIVLIDVHCSFSTFDVPAGLQRLTLSQCPNITHVNIDAAAPTLTHLRVISHHQVTFSSQPYHALPSLVSCHVMVTGVAGISVQPTAGDAILLATTPRLSHLSFTYHDIDDTTTAPSVTATQPIVDWTRLSWPLLRRMQLALGWSSLPESFVSGGRRISSMLHCALNLMELDLFVKHQNDIATLANMLTLHDDVVPQLHALTITVGMGGLLTPLWSAPIVDEHGQLAKESMTRDDIAQLSSMTRNAGSDGGVRPVLITLESNVNQLYGRRMTGTNETRRSYESDSLLDAPSFTINAIRPLSRPHRRYDNDTKVKDGHETSNGVSSSIDANLAAARAVLAAVEMKQENKRSLIDVPVEADTDVEVHSLSRPDGDHRLSPGVLVRFMAQCTNVPLYRLITAPKRRGRLAIVHIRQHKWESAASDLPHDQRIWPSLYSPIRDGPLRPPTRNTPRFETLKGACHYLTTMCYTTSTSPVAQNPDLFTCSDHPYFNDYSHPDNDELVYRNRSHRSDNQVPCVDCLCMLPVTCWPNVGHTQLEVDGNGFDAIHIAELEAIELANAREIREVQRAGDNSDDEDWAPVCHHIINSYISANGSI